MGFFRGGAGQRLCTGVSDVPLLSIDVRREYNVYDLGSVEVTEFRDVDHQVARSLSDSHLNYTFRVLREQVKGPGSPIRVEFERTPTTTTDNSATDNDLRVHIAAVVGVKTFSGGIPDPSTGISDSKSGKLQSMVLCDFDDWIIETCPKVSYEIPEEAQLEVLKKGLRAFEVTVFAYRKDKYLKPTHKSIGLLKGVSENHSKTRAVEVARGPSKEQQGNDGGNNGDDDDNKDELVDVPLRSTVFKRRMSNYTLPNLDESDQIVASYANSKFVELKLPKVDAKFHSSSGGGGEEGNESAFLVVKFRNPYESTSLTKLKITATLGNRSNDGWKFKDGVGVVWVKGELKAGQELEQKIQLVNSGNNTDSGSGGVLGSGGGGGGVAVITVDCAEFGGRNGANCMTRLEVDPSDTVSCHSSSK